MLGLPKATEINKPLSKKAVFDKFKPSPTDRKLFDEQIIRLTIVAEISPQTMAVSMGVDVSAIYVILVILRNTECDKRNIALLSKLIDQRMLFVLQYENEARLAVYRTQKVFISQSKPTDEWALTLSGLDLDAIWVNLIAQIGDIDIVAGKSIEETIQENDRVEKLTRQIEALVKKAMVEKQPRRKWEYVEEIKQLKAKLEEM